MGGLMRIETVLRRLSDHGYVVARLNALRDDYYAVHLRFPSGRERGHTFRSVDLTSMKPILKWAADEAKHDEAVVAGIERRKRRGR